MKAKPRKKMTARRAAVLVSLLLCEVVWESNCKGAAASEPVAPAVVVVSTTR